METNVMAHGNALLYGCVYISSLTPQQPCLQPEAAEVSEHLQGDAEGFALRGEKSGLLAEVDGSGAEAYAKMDEKEDEKMSPLCLQQE